MKILKSISPGLSCLLENWVAPLLAIDEKLGGLDMLEISDVCFPFDSSNDMTYCYPLKLSILCKPGAKEEHEHILSQIDLGVM